MKSSIDDLVSLEIPIYIAYGSEDEIAYAVDLLPIKFIEYGKKNYQIHRYPNLEHNFFPIKDGKTDYSEGKWSEVMLKFVESTVF